MDPDTNRVEQFSIENPPEYYAKRGSNISTLSDEGEDNTNENIIFNNNASSIAIQRNHTKALQISYCGIKGGSELSCILNVIVSAIGSNTFTFSYIIYDSGIIASFLIFMFVTACIYYSMELLRSFIVDTKYYSFALMTETILGKKWLKVYGVSSLVVYLSMVVSYKKMMYTYIMTFFDVDSNIVILIYYFSIAAIEIVVILFTRNTKIQILSIMSIFCFTAILLCIIFFSLKRNMEKDLGKFEKERFFPSSKSSAERFFDILSNFITIVYGYCYHATFPTLIGNLNIVNNKTTKKVHLISFSIIFGAFFLISFFGYMYTSNDSVQRMLFVENLSENDIDDPFVLKMFKLIISLFFFTLIPIRFIIIRDSYTIVIGQKKYTLKQEIIVTTCFIILSNVLVFVMNLYKNEYDPEKLSYFVQIFGGIFGVIICFILPVINYVSVNGKTKIKAIVGYTITGIFVVICVLSQGYSLYKFMFDL